MALFFLSPAMSVQAEELTTMDFSSGYYLEIDNDGPFHSLELPAEVYRAVRRADLGDIRIFDSTGEVVPHGLRPVVEQHEAVRQKDSVPFFPLYASTATGQADLAMHVLRNTAGAIININTKPAPGDDSPQITGYLLDLSGLKWPAGELEFHWQTDRNSSIFNIQLRQSDDLQHWSSLTATAILVDLQHGGARILKRTVPLTYKPKSYLQLTWPAGEPPLLLTQVTGSSQIIGSLQRRQWVDLASGAVHENGGELSVLYQTTAHLPVSSAQFVFQGKNPLARMTLQSRASDQDSWRTRCEQVFYSFGLTAPEVGSVRNEPCSFPLTSDPKWRAMVREDGAGIGLRQQAPILQLGWTPNELVFVSRGTPPFLLAFGSAKLEHQEKAAESDMILQTIGITQTNRKIGVARLGERIELGGDKALHPLPLPRPWQKWLLWAVLIFGVGLLAAMARSLIKEMNKKAENRATEDH